MWDLLRSSRAPVRIAAGLMAALVLVAGLTVRAQTTPKAATQDASLLKEGWEEIDQRLVFLTVQLSTVESTIEATNKALKVNGYQQVVKLTAADQAKRGNELMDRNGGGPVPWQEFYGKTAEKFFYHPKDGSTIHINPDVVAQRPPQFDYIYRANEQNRKKAEDDAAKIGSKIDDLLDYRRQLETDQSALWCKIAFRGVSSRELGARPIYRLDLAGGGSDEEAKQSLEAARASAQFMREITAALDKAQKEMDDQKAALEHLAQVTIESRATLQAKLLRLTALAERIADARSPIGQFSRSAKRLEDSAQNLIDAYKLAVDCEAHNDQNGKQSYRGQLQQMAFDYAATVATADQSISKAFSDWKINAVVKAAETAPAVDTAAAGGIEQIATNLDNAKAARQKEITTARRAFVAAIDTKLNAAADAGDLAQVQALQSAKVKAALDGSLNDDIKDEGLLAAKTQLNDANKAADARLVKAYRDAIATYTKARRITEAQSVQDELNASGLSVAATDANPGGSPGSPASMSTGSTTPVRGSADAAFPVPQLPNGRTEVDLPGPVDEVAVGGGGRYLIFHIKKLQQLAVFDVSQLKVLKYLPVATNDIVFAAGAKKLFVGLKDLKQIQRWDLEKLALELTVPGPEGGISAMATGPSVSGPLILLGAKRFWLVNPITLKAEHFPSKNWGGDGSAWGPVHVHVSFDGTTVVACGGGWAGIELSNITGDKVINTIAGSYVNGDALVSGNGSLVFPDGGSIVRSDLTTTVKGVEGHPFPADDAAFSLAFESSKTKPTLVLFSNSDPRPLVTIRDLPELAKDSKMPPSQRIHLISRAKVLITLADGGEKVILRKFDLAEALEAEGIDYLFIESAPVVTAERGTRYSYKVAVRSKKGGVKMELQSGPKGMTVSKEGLLTWSVPTRMDSASVPVIVQVSDASGQNVFHSFSINIAEVVNRK